MRNRKQKLSHAGGVYIAVLGTALIISLLGLAALVGQRIQNRIVGAAADIRQAQLNANTAVELALLIMKQEANWRTNRPHGTVANWFTNRATSAGTCSVNVIDPIDSNLTNQSTDPVVVNAIGYSGKAVQRARLTVDAFVEPISSLRSTVAAGDVIDLNADTLRTNGLITANELSASSSQVYGSVEAITISGSTYNGTTTQVTSGRRPAMPNWASVFSYYRTNGTEIVYGSLPTTTPNLGRNISFDTNTDYWTGTATGLPTASITRETNIDGHTCSRVHNRTALTAGASQYVDHIVKPGASYTIAIQVYVNSSWGNAFRIKLCTKGSGSAQTSTSSLLLLDDGVWYNVNVTLTAPSWSGDLEYARVTIDTDFVALGSTNSFHIDNLDIREVTTGGLIYRKVLSPTINPFGASTNSQGIYWINCNGNRLVIDRSRIMGTLLVVNPGSNSGIAHGPIHWSPAVAGYPALLVDADTASNADFSIQATNRALSEKENDTNYHPTGAAVSEFDATNAGDKNDNYPSEIRGLIAIEDDLTYQYRPLIRGQILVGDDISNSSGTLEVEFQPESLLNPPPGFLAPNTFQRRPASTLKTVVP